MAKLLISLPGSGDSIHELSGDELTIGREPDNAIQIPEGSVSSHHARLTRTESGGYRLKDLGSTNKTWINGFAINEIELGGEVCVMRLGNVNCIFLPSAQGPLWNEAAKARAELETARQERDGAQKRLAEITAQLEAQRAENAAEKKERETLQKRAADLAAAEEAAQKESAAAKSETASVTRERDEARAERQKAAAQIEAKTAENRALEKRWSEAKSRIDELTAAAEKSAAALEALRAERDAARQEAERFSRELSASRAHAALAGSERDALRIQHTNLLVWANEQQERLDKFQAEREAAAARQEELARKLAEARAEGETRQAAWEKQRAEITAAFEKKEAERAREVEAGREQMRAEIERLTQRWDALVAQLKRAREVEAEVNKALDGEAQFSSWVTHAGESPRPPEKKKNGGREPKPASSAAPLRVSPAAGGSRKSGVPAADGAARGAAKPAVGAATSAAEAEQLSAAVRTMRSCATRLSTNLRDRAALMELFGGARELTEHSSNLPGYSGVHGLASALETLLGGLCKAPEEMDAGKLDTVSRATDTLRLLLEHESGVPAADLSAARICVLGDDAAVAARVRDAIRDAGLEAAVAHLPLAETDQMEQHRCDVAVLDCAGHEEGCAELTARVRQARRHRHLRLVVLTEDAPGKDFPPPGAQEDFARTPIHADEIAVKLMTAILQGRSALEAAPARETLRA